MKGILQRYLFTTVVGALSLGLLLTGLVQAQKQEDKKPAGKGKPPAEKEEASKKKDAERKKLVTTDDSQAPKTKVPSRRPAHQGEPVTFLGVAATVVSPAVRAHLDLPRGVGISIGEVMPESPAAKAGLKAHDVLTKLDDQLLVTPEQFQILVRMKEPGDKVKLTYLRAGKERTLDIALASKRVAFTETRPYPPYPRQEFPFNPHDPRHRGGNYRGSDQWRDLQREWSEKMRDWWEKNGDEISEQFRKAMNEAFENGGELGAEVEDFFDDLDLPHRGHPDTDRERQEREERQRNERRPESRDKDPI